MKEIAMAAQIQQQQQQMSMNSLSKQPVVANRGWPNISASATGFARSPIAATAAPTTNSAWPVHYQPSNAIDDTSRKIDQSFTRAILEDHDKVKRPELSCFTSFNDAINRLLPYHVYQYREKDLRCNLEHFQRDAERNAVYFTEKSKVLDERMKKLMERYDGFDKTEVLETMADKLLLYDDRRTFEIQKHQYHAVVRNFAESRGIIIPQHLQQQQMYHNQPLHQFQNFGDSSNEMQTDQQDKGEEEPEAEENEVGNDMEDVSGGEEEENDDEGESDDENDDSEDEDDANSEHDDMYTQT
ncbi:hypothetical protein MP638_006342 [Amoeboaphelidium occidentale]|nr:hypothetical protein MP638_006342 [Amoeboaphelidium occidentale]